MIVITQKITASRTRTNLNVRKIFFTGLLIMAVIFQARIVYSQEKNISSGAMTWFQYYNKTKLTDKWMWKNDGGYRWINLLEESNQFITRTSIGYALNQSIRVSAGFAYLGYFSSGDLNIVEYRPYQELTIKNDFHSFMINHRYRVEERFSHLLTSNGDESSRMFNFRFRYAFMLKIPVLKVPVNHKDRKLMLNIGDEILLNAGEEIISNIFDQNRFIISPGIQFSKNLSLHMTWNLMFASKADSRSYSYNNVFWLQVKHRLDFRKMKAQGH